MFYNPKHRYGSANGLSPVAFEKPHFTTAQECLEEQGDAITSSA